MATRTITIHDQCTVPGCGRTLHSIKEGESGVCASCWVKSLSPDAKEAMNRLVAAAFNGSSAADKEAAADEVFERSRRGEYT